MIYFILNPTLNHVKIGYTNNLLHRLTNLQIGNSITLKIIGVIKVKNNLAEKRIRKNNTRTI